jgi:hypothetical protein
MFYLNQSHVVSRCSRATAAAFALVAASCAQTGQSQGTGEEITGTAELVVNGDDGIVYEGSAGTIRVAEEVEPPVQVSMVAASRAQIEWTANLGLSTAALESGAASISLRRAPLEAGTGVVAVGSQAAPEAVESGELSIILGADRTMSGNVAAAPDTASAVFSGRYVLSCWVAPAALGQAPSGSPSSGTVERVEDVEFSTQFCSRFDHLR